MATNLQFAPRDAFDVVLKWAVIPTFDLVLSYGDQGVIVVRRRISPYKGLWALPGLRMFKPESIDDVIRRIAKDEVGLGVNPERREFLGQYVGRFRTEHGRQDLSTGYHLRVDPAQQVQLNDAHFTQWRLVDSIPRTMGAMYRYYLRQHYLSTRQTTAPTPGVA